MRIRNQPRKSTWNSVPDLWYWMSGSSWLWPLISWSGQGTVTIGGSCNLVSASFCDFSNYKCTTEKKEATSFPPKIRQVSDPGESEKPKSMASDQSAEIREQGPCKCFRLSLNILICYIYFWDACATASDFTLRSCMNDSNGQVFSLKKVVRRADYDLLILFLCKDRIKRQFFHNVGDQH
jgi:hypothetical protein